MRRGLGNQPRYIPNMVTKTRKTVYVASDGQEFGTKLEAEKHDLALALRKEIEDNFFAPSDFELGDALAHLIGKGYIQAGPQAKTLQTQVPQAAPTPVATPETYA